MDGNGYPTALTPERHKALITELKVGDWPAMAAVRAKCSPSTVQRWVTEGCQPAAVEPYATFAADFVAVEAQICGQLTAVIMDRALGRSDEGDPYWAKWLLETRFRFLWNINSGKGGVSVAELVVGAIEVKDAEMAQKARDLLKQLPEPAKAEARKAGFLI
jgi:hypothetical protein